MSSQELAAMRKSLDDIDAVLLSALGERARLSRQIADVKAAEEGPVRDADRETALLQHRSAFGERLGLDPRSSAGCSARSWTTRCGGSRTRCRIARRTSSRK